MTWTVERIAELKQLWTAGHTTSHIGKVLGISKSAVIGKTHRLNLPSRLSHIRRSSEHRKPKPELFFMSVRDQYDSLIATYAAAVGRGDAEAVAGLFAEDAIVLAPDQLSISGRQAIRDYYEEAVGDGFPVTINVQDIQDCGDTVYGTGTFEFEDGTGKWLQVLHPQGDGTLLIHRLCWNQN